MSESNSRSNPADRSIVRHALTMPGMTGGWTFDTVPGLAKIANEINRQAAMIGYLNAFMMYTAMSAFAVVVALMARRHRSS